MIGSMIFSLVLVTAGTVNHMAQFQDLKACEQEVQRLENRFDGSATVLACVPVNTVGSADIDRRWQEMMTTLRSEEFDRQFNQMLETLRDLRSRIDAPQAPQLPSR